MAELVDALVSNTSGSNTVPVRPRLRVLFRVKLPYFQGAFLFDSPLTIIYIDITISAH